MTIIFCNIVIESNDQRYSQYSFWISQHICNTDVYKNISIENQILCYRLIFVISKKIGNFCKLPKFQDPILCDFACFGGDFSLQMALQMRKFIVEPCYGYLKHSPDSGEYVSKKNYGHTIHRTESKAGK